MIQVVERTFAVLEYLARDPQGRNRLSDIAEGANLNASTCARILKTLGRLGYVVKYVEGGGYSLGSKAYSLVDRSSYRYDLVLAGRTFMTQFVRKLNESILLATLYHGNRIVLYEIEAEHLIKAHREAVNDCDSPLRTATGRLMLAYLPEAERGQLVADARSWGKFWPQMANKAQVFEALDEIRRQGWAKTRNESDVVGVAVPLREAGAVVAALASICPHSGLLPSGRRRSCGRCRRRPRKSRKRFPMRAKRHLIRQ
jgi:DNA-binding IclR family transcriptional regulator